MKKCENMWKHNVGDTRYHKKMSSCNQLRLTEKLTGRENYSTRRFVVKTHLDHEELWICIENIDDPIVDFKQLLKGKSKVILLMDTENYIHIQQATTAKEEIYVNKFSW